MALPDTLPSFTPDEYLAFERGSESKHEYRDGLIYAMAGASPEHSTICVNVSAVITSLAGSISIASINCRLPLAEVYEWVRFPMSESPASASDA